MLDGREVLDEHAWFEPGRHYENVRIVMTDRRSQVHGRVSEANGTPTGGEHPAVAFLGAMAPSGTLYQRGGAGAAIKLSGATSD